MVTEYGMSDKLGTVQYEDDSKPFAGRQYGQHAAYSENIAFEIDNEVRRIMEEAHQDATEIITAHRQQLDVIANKLLEIETLDKRQIKSLFETGHMPLDSDEEEAEQEPEKADSFEEAKEKAQEEADPSQAGAAPGASEINPTDKPVDSDPNL